MLRQQMIALRNSLGRFAVRLDLLFALIWTEMQRLPKSGRSPLYNGAKRNLGSRMFYLRGERARISVFNKQCASCKQNFYLNFRYTIF